MKRIILLIISVCFATMVNAQVSSSIFFLNVTCYGGNDGSITFTNPSGANIYEFSIDGGDKWQSSPVFTGLTAQNYLLVVRNAESIINKTDIGNFQLKQPALLSATVTATSETFAGSGNGAITVSSPKGGSGDYEYSIDGINWSNSVLFTNLTSGTYIIVIRDKNVPNCKITIQKTIQPAGSLSADVVATNIICSPKNGGTNDGSIVFSNASGATDFDYSVDDGANWQPTGIFNGLAAGTYKTKIRDRGNTANVVALDVITITEPKELEALYSPTVPLCAGTSGTLQIFARGGTGIITGTGKFSMAAGERSTFIVSDENGCTDEVTYTMYAPTKIVATAVVTEPKCLDPEGTVTITATGGNGELNGVGTFSVNQGGSYSFIVTDSNGCISNRISGLMPTLDHSVGSIVISESISEIDFQSQRMGSINLQVAGGSGGYVYNWSNGAVTKDIHDLKEGGIYTVTVTDSNGCIESKSITLAVPNYIPIAKTGGDQVVYEGVTVTLDGTSSSDANQDNLSYIWTAPVGILLSNSTSSKPSFLAPDVKRDTILTFILVVNDGKVNSSPTTSKVAIQNLIKVGNTELSVHVFKVYPNPTTGMVSIEFTQDQGKKTEVSVSSILGVEVFRKVLNEVTKYKFDLSKQVDGIYMLRVIINNKQYLSKIVLRR